MMILNIKFDKLHLYGKSFYYKINPSLNLKIKIGLYIWIIKKN